MQSKFTKKERLEIGRQIFERELNQEKAAAQYDISPYTARDSLSKPFSTTPFDM